MKSVMDQDKSTLEDTNSDPQIDEDFENSQKVYSHFWQYLVAIDYIRKKI